MNRRALSEQDVCLRYITPALEKSGWDKMTQIRTEYTFTAGRVLVKGRLSSRDKNTKYRADYILSYKDSVPLAVVEAKDNTHAIADGIQQAIKYATMLDLPFAYASNGDGFVEHSFITGKERKIALEEFPTPSELWKSYLEWKGLDTREQETTISEPFHYKDGGDTPRYYQKIAVNRVLEAVARGKRRVLLAMATGTGKTFTAFQIMWRLRKAGKVNKILFLVDRNILIDQSLTKDFSPFTNVLVKVRNRVLNSAYEVYFALYQQLVSSDGEDTYKQFLPEFFDLIVIDECHRGSANEEGSWRKVLDYFSSAIHIGMTATPKETAEVSSIEYFGSPVYTYSLAQGIKDGFLAPYRVIRVHLDKDLLGYLPEKGKTDIHGELLKGRIYKGDDFEKKIVVDERTQIIAAKITEYLKKNDRMMKTIVFCVDTEHASRMREALVNENLDMVKEDDRYVMRITGNDEEGKAQLENFIAVDEKYPVIAVTSELMTTGVDAKMTKLIVIDKAIDSMITFKQIVGRGTRIREEDGKMYFTLMDFRNVSLKFADPDFDGEPIKVKDIWGDESIPGEDEPDDENPEETEDPGVKKHRSKTYVDGVPFSILKESRSGLDEHGNLIQERTEGDFKDAVLERYPSPDLFRGRWLEERNKQAILDELESLGVVWDDLRERVGGNYDVFDLVMWSAFGSQPLSRLERVAMVRESGLMLEFSPKKREIVEVLLKKYVESDAVDFGSSRVLRLPELSVFGSPVAIKDSVFGGAAEYDKTIEALESELYG